MFSLLISAHRVLFGGAEPLAGVGLQPDVGGAVVGRAEGHRVLHALPLHPVPLPPDPHPLLLLVRRHALHLHLPRHLLRLLLLDRPGGGGGPGLRAGRPPGHGGGPCARSGARPADVQHAGLVPGDVGQLLTTVYLQMNLGSTYKAFYGL